MIVDIVVGAVIIISALISFLRGFIRETLTILGVVGGILAAFFFGPDLAPTMREWLGAGEGAGPEKLFDIIPMEHVADVLAYGSIFIIVVIILSVVSHFTAGAAKAMGLGPVDRTLGVIFGIARGLVLLGLLYLPFHLLMDEDTKIDVFSGSRTHIFIEKTAEIMAGFLPDSEDVEKEIDKGEDKIKKKLLEQELLRGDDDTEEVPKVPEPKDTGYDDTEREKLEDLFDDKSDFNE